MEFKNNKIKDYIFLSTYIILLIFFFINIKDIMNFLYKFLGIIKPFIWGIAIAFILNIPVKLIEKNLGNSKFFKGMKRSFSITLTFLFFILAITLFILFVIPQLLSSISTLMNSIPEYLSQFEKFLEVNAINNSQSQVMMQNIINELLNMWKEILKVTSQIVGTSLGYLLDFTLGITYGVINFFLSLILAIYMLASKEILISQLKLIIYAFVSKNKADRIIELGKMCNEMFSKFILGQCTEALVIGVLCFIGMIILKMPYALLISVVIGVTALIPVFGAFLGTIPSAFIILIMDPIKALWFIIFIIVLQQLEGNLIYPRVVGSSIGLSALWVMFAMIVGGSLFGIIGMLIGIPIFGVVFKILKRVANRKINEKGIERR
ncbi:AI-2E family transporter [Clostridium perfringens]|uniref:AI-2E family transporter n=13 Tax=Clostridium perfringens TaxID=1502 RepID=A0A6G4ZEA2_CLOPF|nr:AI-2E family transporter [Clostridium perfringens]ALG47922.1 putative membrane protein [Clostridium perfringens]ATD49572.1 AI-2E family transporter [Clostridium perfringens]EDT25070.1 putative membrane protein [Clostridium perfringens B str. ATCC 3626]EHK2306030.1 AI-2E family transporter [Clostridium perfringens]EHK2403295.1 AI-2E family transporter [Clostridium perfringens]